MAESDAGGGGLHKAHGRDRMTALDSSWEEIS